MSGVVEHDPRAWDPLAYWREYYAGDAIESDERAMFAFCVDVMARDGRRFDRMLDVGCGPTVHRLAPFAPHVEAIEVADHDPRNLEHVASWVRNAGDALRWDKFLALTLELEGAPAGADAVEARARSLRALMTAMLPCDVRRRHPLGAPASYPLVTTFFCADCITTSRERWNGYMGNVLGLVAPGGRLVMTALGESDGYPVGDLSFPSAGLTTDDVRRVLVEDGFEPSSVLVERAPLPADERRPYAALGHVLMASAVRGRA